jgi:hypothetical protein
MTRKRHAGEKLEVAGPEALTSRRDGCAARRRRRPRAAADRRVVGE